MSKRAELKRMFLNRLISSGKTQVSKSEINQIANEIGMITTGWFTNDENNKVSRGIYRVPGAEPAAAYQTNVVQMPKNVEKTSDRIANITTDLDTTNLIPEKYSNYVPFGNFEDVYSVIKSERFFPIFITGHSGNGKTMSVEQACAKAKRKFICISMTPETDESDLLGNYVLINGQMQWRDGPVTIAAREGAVLCIDEIDYGAQNLSTLQRVLEGKPFLLKKKGELITPARGFNIIATANTKGKGSDDGRYMFTNVLNEAFLERFPNTLEQTWPPILVEKRIIRKELESVGSTDEDFADKLVTWADVIRKTFDDGGCDEVISTRRLVHIVKSFGIYNSKIKAIEMCLNRFDDDTKASFIDLYTKVDSGVRPMATDQPAQEPVQENKVEVPF